MLRRYLIWREKRRRRRRNYRLATQKDWGVYGPGFHGLMRRIRFREKGRTPIERRRRRRRWGLRIVTLIALFALGWFVWESLHALRLF